MISAHGLTRSFDGRIAVDQVSFDVPAGALFALLGPNGAGKTTTVRLLLGLIAPTGGSAVVAGHRVGGPPPTGRALRAACGLLTETPGFYDRMSAQENLRFFGRLYGMSDATVRDRAEKYLRLMDLWDRRDSVVGTFSKGMKQRLAIIRALFHDPRVVFLDEPTAGLDPEAARDVRELIRGLKAEGRTLLVCTHNLDEAERLADIVGILRRRLVACDTLERLRAGGDRSAVRIVLAAAAEPFAAALRGVAGVRDVRAEGSALLVRVAEFRGGVPSVVAALAAAGAPVLEVRPEMDDLEAVYLRAVRDEP